VWKQHISSHTAFEEISVGVFVGGIMIVKCVEIYVTSESKPVRFVY
jgi:hypothetical protein